MKKINIISLIIVIFGLVLLLLFNYLPCYDPDPHTCGFGKVILSYFVAFPLILIGIILFIVSWIIGRIKSKK